MTPTRITRSKIPAIPTSLFCFFFLDNFLYFRCRHAFLSTNPLMVLEYVTFITIAIHLGVYFSEFKKSLTFIRLSRIIDIKPINL
ncbi:hypothetical protein C1P36_02485 [Listeria monocytogenes]|nr:hypothetical protein EGX62_08580 [Listeria monocytogenes]EAC7069497.1 hypothetical protein [Listeria monocytogenes]EAD8309996.1 hypothetical protein [Listeria monocytogenes]EAE5345760.1 hypothetical protein [Listeria monocytogenes]EAE6400395.1 hypothetical protein [Listeria monocytogenes]